MKSLITKINTRFKALPRPMLWLIGCILLWWIGFLIYHSLQPSQQVTGEEPLYQGSPYTITRGDLKKSITFNGNTAFSNAQKLTFWQNDLKVTKVFVKVGDEVRAWQVLASLDTSTLDNELKTARTNLEKAKRDYERSLTTNDHKQTLLKAENDLAIAKVELQTIERTITIANQEEDNHIEIKQSELEKAKLALEKAQKTYDNLNCTESHCINKNSAIRTEQKTYDDAIEDLRNIRVNINGQLDIIDKIMFFSEKYNTHGSMQPSEYIGYNKKHTITQTAQHFHNTRKALQHLEKEYQQLKTTTAKEITLSQLEQAYDVANQAARSFTLMSQSAQDMFKASLVGRGIGGAGEVFTQTQVDELVTQAEWLYSTAKTIQNGIKTTIEKLYDLDTVSSLDAAKQALHKAQQTVNQTQIDLDKLQLNKTNRPNLNEAKRLEAKNKVLLAQQKIDDLHNGHGNEAIENAKNTLEQAQSTVENIVKRYENYQLIANFGGTVTEAKIQVGDVVNSNSNTYIYVENPNLIEVALQIEQTDILAISKGDPVNVVLDILPEDIFTGVIAELSTVPSNGNSGMGGSTYTAKVVFEKPAHKKILWGMSATITYTLSQKENVILVPNAALNMRDGAPTVTMADGSERTIEIGESDMYHTEVLSGLQEGDSILSITIFAQDINSAGIMDENAERMMQMASEWEFY